MKQTKKEKMMICGHNPHAQQPLYNLRAFECVVCGKVNIIYSKTEESIPILFSVDHNEEVNAFDDNGNPIKLGLK